MPPDDRWRWDGIISCVLFASTLVFIPTVAWLRVGPLVWLVIWVVGALVGWSGFKKGRRASRIVAAVGLAVNGLGLVAFVVALAYGTYRIWTR
jgi:hypothetical protein